MKAQAEANHELLRASIELSEFDEEILTMFDIEMPPSGPANIQEYQDIVLAIPQLYSANGMKDRSSSYLDKVIRSKAPKEIILKAKEMQLRIEN
jgi:hypothetical protein